MPGDSVVIGPFVGGLNNISTAGEADDKEVVDLINFEVSKDTSLTSRPPMQAVAGSVISSDQNWDVLGIFREAKDKWHLIVQKKVGANTIVYSALGGDLSLLVQIRSTADYAQRVSSFVQVDDYGYFATSPESATSGAFKWKPGTALVAIADMPVAYSLVSHKGRIWAAGRLDATNSSTLYFSTIDESGSKYDVWKPATDYIKIASGEGGFITTILSLNSSILIFKDDGTWRFSYPTSPTKGQVDKISGTIGASGKHAVAEFENLVYVYDKGNIYELINNNYSMINSAIEFRTDATSVDLDVPGVELSIAARRLFVHYRNTLYAFNVDTKTWSQWRSYVGVPNQWLELPQDINSQFPPTFIASSKGKEQNINTTYLTAKEFRDSVEYFESRLPAGTDVFLTGTTLEINTSSLNAISRIFDLYLNKKGADTEYSINLSAGRKFTVAGNLLLPNGSFTVEAVFRKIDGTTVTESQAGTTDFSLTFTAPDQAIAAFVRLIITTIPSTTNITSTGITVAASSGASPVSLITFADYYPDTNASVEFIECTVRTKSYDYKVPTVYKRLFWWAMDHKSNLYFRTKAVPIRQQPPIKWGQLSEYTHSQLSAGTFGNPLRFLGVVVAESDTNDVSNTLTDNGRILSKMSKAIRFRQIYYEITMITLGNKVTGPCKIFTLTTFVKPKEKVFDKNS